MFATSGKHQFGRFIFFLFCAGSLMLCDSFVPAARVVHEFLSFSLFSLQYLIQLPQEATNNALQFFKNKNQLLQANKALQEANFTLQVQLERLEAIEHENQQLKGTLLVAKKIKNRSLLAQVVAVNSNFYTSQLILNKGEKFGVYVGQPVLDNFGVLGQVIQTTPVSSTVLLLNSKNSGISVEGLRNGLRSVAVGDGDSEYLHLTNIPQTADVKVGDIFLTSSLSNRYPKGYYVGKVIKIEHDPGLSFSKIILAPSARLSYSKQVLLLWPNLSNEIS